VRLIGYYIKEKRIETAIKIYILYGGKGKKISKFCGMLDDTGDFVSKFDPLQG